MWEKGSGINIARTKFGVVQCKNKIFALGGKLNDGTRTDIVETYDVETDSWAQDSFVLPRPRSGFSSCILNEDLVFVIGGNDG